MIRNIGLMCIVLISYLYICDSSTCDMVKFFQCAEKIKSFGGETDLFVFSPEGLDKECPDVMDAAKCVTENSAQCLTDEQRKILFYTTEGKLALVKDICTPGTEVHKKYIDNMGCFQELRNATLFCHEKFEISQLKINEEIDMERVKLYYSCCAFEWHRKCKMKAAERHCGHEMSQLVDHMAITLGGEILTRLCEENMSSCNDRLYGVDSAFNKGITLVPMLFLLLTLPFALLNLYTK